MRASSRKPNQGGFTLLEVMIFSSIAIALSYALIPYLNQPRFIRDSVKLGDAQRNAMNAMDIIISDMKEAYPSQIPWDTIVPADAPDLDSITVKRANYAAGAVEPTNYNTITIQYNFLTRNITRTESFPDTTLAPKVTTLFDDMDPPTSINPLFQKDPQEDAYHVIIVTLMYTPQGLPTQRLIRRVAAKG